MDLSTEETLRAMIVDRDNVLRRKEAQIRELEDEVARLKEGLNGEPKKRK